MPITIGTNIASLDAQRELGKSTDELARVYQRLSSGQRINNASDDAAGLAIASALQSTSRIQTQAIRNVNDGVSTLSIADSAIQQLGEILQRQGELATEASNGTYGTAQRTALQNESNQLTNEYNRIVATTSFNGIALLNGSTSQMKLQVGTSSSASSSLSVDLSGLAGPTSTTTTTTTTNTASSGTSEVDTFNFGSLSTAGESYGIFVDPDYDFSSDDDPAARFTFNVRNSSGGQDTYAVWFNNGSSQDPGFANEFEVDVSDQPDSLTLVNRVADAISGVANISVGTTGGGGGSSITITNTIAGNVTNIASFPPELAFINQQGQDISGDSFNFSTPSGNYYAWFHDTSLSTNDNPNIAGRTGIQINYNSGDSAATIRTDAINAINAQLGGQVTATATSSTYALGLTITNLLSGTVTAPSVANMGGLSAVTRNTTGGTGSPVNPATDQITINSHGYTTGQALTLSTNGTLPSGLSAGTTYYAIVVDANTIKLATSAANASGGIAVDITSNGTGTTTFSSSTSATTTGTGSFITNLDLSTQSAARSSLDTIAAQQQHVVTAIGSIGASQSRLNSIVNTLTVARENNIAAAARITDVDVASESSELVREQILQQAAASVLAQANQEPSLALKLLQ